MISVLLRIAIVVLPERIITGIFRGDQKVIMYLEDRVTELEKQVKELTDKVTHLESVNNDKWVSVKELAEIMGVSTNTIYIKIRSGEVYATRKLGSPRIPLSQFYCEGEKSIKSRDKNNRELNEIKEIIFEE